LLTDKKNDLMSFKIRPCDSTNIVVAGELLNNFLNMINTRRQWSLKLDQRYHHQSPTNFFYDVD